MATKKTPGPLGSLQRIDQGTLCRNESPQPGPVGCSFPDLILAWSPADSIRDLLPVPWQPYVPPVVPLPPTLLPVGPGTLCELMLYVKYFGYMFWREHYVTAPHWRQVMDAWFWETGPNPLVYNGLSDPRNADISANAGFQELLRRWAAGERGRLPDGSLITPNGFTWSYEIDVDQTCHQLQFVVTSPGGGAAFNSATHFLGSYDVTLSPCRSMPGAGQSWLADVKNLSHWASGTRFPAGVLRAIRSVTRGRVSLAALFTDHERGRGPCGRSIGGNLTQHYRFEIPASFP